MFQPFFSTYRSMDKNLKVIVDESQKKSLERIVDSQNKKLVMNVLSSLQQNKQTTHQNNPSK